MNKSVFFFAVYLIGIALLIGYMFINVPSALASENLASLPAGAAISIEPSREIPLTSAEKDKTNPRLAAVIEATRFHNTFETSA